MYNSPMRIRASLIVFGAILVVLTYTLPLWQPLLRPQAVQPDTVIPGMSQTTEQTFLTLPQEQQDAYFAVAATSQPSALAMIRAAFAPPIDAPPTAEGMAALANAARVGSGAFERIDAVRWGQGDVTVYQQADNSRRMLFEEFSVANGPDLHVFLSLSPAPLTPELVRAQNSEIDLGQLLGTRGTQAYTIAPETELARYASVVIYSTSLEMVYSYAPLFLRS